MGIFNILKRKKKEGKLDLPPPPPISKPKLKEVTQPKQFPKLPEIPKFKPLPVPKFKPSIPKFDIPKFKPKFQTFPKPDFKSKISKLNIPRFKPKEILERPVIKPLKRSYIDIESFKDITSHINEIKKKIKESEQVIVKLNEIKNKEDKVFGKWHSKFEDVQKKLVYVDKFLGG